MSGRAVERYKADDPEFVCVGRDGTWDCPHAPEFVVAGDLSCRFHLQSIVRRRISEIRRGASVRLTETIGRRAQ